MVINSSKPKYKPYEPTKWERRVDGIVGLVSTKAALGRMMNREKMNRFRYMASQQTASRRNSTPFSPSVDTQIGNRERMQVMWNAIELLENSGLMLGIRTKFCDYVCGQLRWQSRTGDRFVNDQYEHYLKSKFSRSMDVAGRNSIRGFGRLIVSGTVVKGDAGVNTVRESAVTATGRIVYDDDIYFQGIEADRIGHPYDYTATPTYIGGVHLSPYGRHLGYDVFSRNRKSGQYQYTDTVPAYDAAGLPQFMLVQNPIYFDEVRGRSVFRTAIDSISYLQDIRNFELQALQWAASQSGVFSTKDGNLPDMAFDAPKVDAETGQQQFSFKVTPNNVQAIGIGEEIKMFQHDRPSPNVLAIYRETIKDIAAGCGLSYGFVYDMSGILGGAVRSAAAQDKRALITWKECIKEGALMPMALLMLGNGIANGEIPPHPKWYEGEFFFPPHPTIDAGYDSAAAINENNAGFRSRAMVCAEESNDNDEIRTEIGNEKQADIREAKRIAAEEGISDWREVYGFLFPQRAINQSPLLTSSLAIKNLGTGVGNDPALANDANEDAPGVTSTGVDLP